MHSKRAIIIDGNSLFFRAYYAIKANMSADGMATNAIYGFLSMLYKSINDFSPDYIAVAFDLGGKTFRHEKFDDYKANRRKTDDALLMQIPVIKEILAAMNIKILQKKTFEGDDIIGSFARFVESDDVEVIIISGDKDMFQLISDNTKIAYTKRGISNIDIYDIQKFEDEYNFAPKHFIDYKAIMGDSSDNYKGVKGIGDKGARNLVTKYQTIENIYQNIDEISGKTKLALENSKMQAFMGKELATIIVNLDLGLTLDDVKLVDPDFDMLASIYKNYKLNTFLKKLETNGCVNGTNDDETDELKGMLSIDVSRDVGSLEATLKKADVAGLCLINDSNHIDKPEIYAAYFNVDGNIWLLDDMAQIHRVLDIVAEEKVKVVGYDLKNALFALLQNGLPLFTPFFDVMLAYEVINNKGKYMDFYKILEDQLGIDVSDKLLKAKRKKTLTADDIKERYVNIYKSFKKIKNDVVNAALGDVESSDENARIGHEEALLYLLETVNIFKVYDKLKSQIEEDDLQKVFYEIEMPLVEVIASMENTGVWLDTEFLKTYEAELSNIEAELLDKIYELAGFEFNVNSPKQLGEVLFEKLNLEPKVKTKRGYSTNAEVLQKLRKTHPIIDLILEFRKVSKLNSTYVRGFMNFKGTDGKVRPEFLQIGASTGRMACINPALQTIPVKTDMGKKIRKAFKAGKDRVFVSADYSQIELRILGHVSCDEGLINAFKSGEDIHEAVAVNVLGAQKGAVSKAVRSKAKAINFGVIYGMSDFGLSNELEISRKDAKKYIDEYFAKHRAVYEYMEAQKSIAKQTGAVRTETGRIRKIPEINAQNIMVRNLGERLAMNSPIQGMGADIMKLAMNNVYRSIQNQGLDARIVLQIHDELVIDASVSDSEKVKKLLKNEMEAAYNLKTGLIANPQSGENLYDI